mmetsp:Transcript_2848/g.6358  ORF Transcript_2848/g.6358 Transcript_2848/m.6358 type:complete len:355 (-) Transcript_2848:888-1952(-)
MGRLVERLGLLAASGRRPVHLLLEHGPRQVLPLGEPIPHVVAEAAALRRRRSGDAQVSLGTRLLARLLLLADRFLLSPASAQAWLGAGLVKPLRSRRAAATAAAGDLGDLPGGDLGLLLGLVGLLAALRVCSTRPPGLGRVDLGDFAPPAAAALGPRLLRHLCEGFVGEQRVHGEAPEAPAREAVASDAQLRGTPCACLAGLEQSRRLGAPHPALEARPAPLPPRGAGEGGQLAETRRGLGPADSPRLGASAPVVVPPPPAVGALGRCQEEGHEADQPKGRPPTRRQLVRRQLTSGADPPTEGRPPARPTGPPRGAPLGLVSAPLVFGAGLAPGAAPAARPLRAVAQRARGRGR